jgi:hypothetical protein
MLRASVPEAAVDEYRETRPTNNDIGFPGEMTIQPIAYAKI